jgi:hypothetical protein
VCVDRSLDRSLDRHVAVFLELSLPLGAGSPSTIMSFGLGFPFRFATRQNCHPAPTLRY